MSLLWFLPVVAGLSWGLTAAVRRYALAHSLLDVPNARSSHSVPTPRGGGVAIVVSFLAALPLFGIAGALPWPAVWALVGAGGTVALVGFLDDHGHVAVRWRLLAHFAVSGWVLGWMGGVPPLVLEGLDLAGLGPLALVVAALYLVWVLNLYNFMDGIDGIAGMEAICVAGGGALLYLQAGQPGLALVPLALAAAAAGFLAWNFPPARIFMGDAGSGFLGIVLGALSLQAGWVQPNLFWSWMVLLGVFVVDATVTLLRRLAVGERIYEAHHSHAYQHAARRCGGHRPVTLVVGAINLLWLLPIALCVGAWGLNGVLGVALAYVPLMLLAWKLGAGRT